MACSNRISCRLEMLEGRRLLDGTIDETVIDPTVAPPVDPTAVDVPVDLGDPMLWTSFDPSGEDVETFFVPNETGDIDPTLIDPMPVVFECFVGLEPSEYPMVDFPSPGFEGGPIILWGEGEMPPEMAPDIEVAPEPRPMAPIDWEMIERDFTPTEEDLGDEVLYTADVADPAASPLEAAPPESIPLSADVDSSPERQAVAPEKVFSTTPVATSARREVFDDPDFDVFN